jgi:hypothetical protein
MEENALATLYFPTYELFNNILSIWTDLCLTSPKFPTKSIASFESKYFLFDRIVVTHSLHDPSSSCTLLHCPLLNKVYPN